MSASADVERVVSHTLDRYGRIDGLANSAAIHSWGTILLTSEDVRDRVIDMHLKDMFLCKKALLPHMIRPGGSSNVNIASEAGWGQPNLLAYSASKVRCSISPSLWDTTTCTTKFG